MRLIDADALAEFLKDAVKRQKYDDLNIDGLLTVADVIEAIISELNGTSLNGFKNAPTIELRCENCEAFNKTRLLIPQPERKTGRWIPCSERLPEEGERVLATHLGGLNPNRQVIEHIYSGGKFLSNWDMDMEFSSPTFGERYMGKVIAWVPLPEPYRAERRTDD